MERKGDVKEWKMKGKERKGNGKKKRSKYHDFKTCQHFPFFQKNIF